MNESICRLRREDDPTAGTTPARSANEAIAYLRPSHALRADARCKPARKASGMPASVRLAAAPRFRRVFSLFFTARPCTKSKPSPKSCAGGAKKPGDEVEGRFSTTSGQFDLVDPFLLRQIDRFECSTGDDQFTVVDKPRIAVMPVCKAGRAHLHARTLAIRIWVEAHE